MKEGAENMEKVEGEVTAQAPAKTKPTITKKPSYTAPMIEWAIYYASIGFKVFPVKPRTKNEYYADYDHRGKTSEKHPSGNPYSWEAQATNDIERIKRIWSEHPDANIGGCTGAVSNGIYATDEDERESGSGKASIKKWEDEGKLPSAVNHYTWTSITGSDSRQYFYYLAPEYIEAARQNNISLAGDSDMIEEGSHVDTRGDGRYVILPPSIHPNGKRYRWDEEKNPSTIEIADFDRTIEFLFTHKSNKAKNKKASRKINLSEGEKVPKGSRRAYMLSTVGELVHKMFDFSDSVIVAAAMEIARKDLDTTEPLDSGWDGLQRDIEQMVYDFRSAIEKERAEDQTTDWTYCVRAWHLEHPNEKLPESIDKEGWKEIKAAGDRRKQKEVDHPGATTPNKESTATSNEKSIINSCLKVSVIDEKPIEWLISGYIPKGQISTIAGDGGAGKTSIWCLIVAAVSRGEQPEILGIPFKVVGENKRVVYFSSEDTTENVLKRRLLNYGADLENVLTIPITDDNFHKIYFVSDELKELIREYKPALCVFDPIQGFIPATVKMGERNAMRQCLAPLITLGEQYGTTFIIIVHSNKRTGASGRNRIADSADIWDISRSVLMVGDTGQDNIKYFSHEKTNYGELSDTILFTICDGLIKGCGTTKKRDKDFMAYGSNNERPTPARDEAREFILDSLENGEMLVSDLEESAKAVGISKNAMRNAKDDLKKENLIKYRPEKDGNVIKHWFICLCT